MIRIPEKSKKILQGEKGANAVEFALLVPVLLLIIIGIIHFGILFNYYLAITHAAREGVRWAALEEPASVVRAKTILAAPELNPQLTDANISISLPDATIADQGKPVTVSISYSVNIPGMTVFFGGPFVMKSSATQRIE